MSARSLVVPPSTPRDGQCPSPRSPTTTRIGRFGESVARDYLWVSGHRIVAMNAREGHDELDIVSIDNAGTLVFSEVRAFTRRTGSHPSGLATLRGPKLQRWARAARSWRQHHPEFVHHRCRFDALAVELSTPARVAHVRGITIPSPGERSFSSDHGP